MHFRRSALIALGLLASGVVVPPQPGVNAQPRPPFAGGMAGGDKPSPKTASLQKKAGQIEAQYKKKPTPQLKSQLAQAYYEYGHAMMTDDALGFKVKYRGALKAYRQALKYNPNHKQAKADKKMIEKIYREMGRPIPE